MINPFKMLRGSSVPILPDRIDFGGASLELTAAADKSTTPKVSILGSALSITTFGTAVAKLRAQTDADGKPIDLGPAVLTVCPALEATAKQIINSTQVMPDQSVPDMPMANPWAASVKLEIEPRLSNGKFTGNSTTQWYLFSDPMNTPATIICSLNGTEPAPIVEQTDLPANQLGIGFRGYCDFGVAVADYRAAVKATGAA